MSSKGIEAFLDAVSNSKGNELHSFMLIRHGKVIAEGNWLPYRSDYMHDVASVSKSFTSTAIGFAVTSGLLKPEDKVITFFPDELPEVVSDNLKTLTVKNLLTMSAGQETEPRVVGINNENWIKSFLAYPVSDKPGTKFLYNPMATYMLSAILQKVTGQKTSEYLNEKLFKLIGIRQADWTESPQGITSGGWGMRLKIEDMARFGLFYLQKGKWDNKQMLPESWITEASKMHIMQNTSLISPQSSQSDNEQGYGYQFWRSKHNSYRADGAYGQFIVVMPDQDAVLIIVEEANDGQAILNSAWEYLIPSMHLERLSESADAYASLVSKQKSLTLFPLPKSEKTYSVDKSYVFPQNESKISELSLKMQDSSATIRIKKDGTDFQFVFGNGKWLNQYSKLRGITNPETFISLLENKAPDRLAGSFNWEGENHLKLMLLYLESQTQENINKEILSLQLSPDKITIVVENPRHPGRTVKLEGIQQLTN